MTAELGTVALVSTFPPALAMSLIAEGRDVPGVRAQLAAVAADWSPAAADAAASDYAQAALRLIRDGHDDPARLAANTLTVCEAAGGRWTR